MARVIVPEDGKIVQVDETCCWVRWDRATSTKSKAWNKFHAQGWQSYRFDNLHLHLMPHPEDAPADEVADGRRRRSRG